MNNDRATPQFVDAVPGLVYVEDFILPSYEAELIAHIDQQDTEWITELARRVQHYGYHYDYKAHQVTEEDYIGPLPAWLSSLADQLTNAGLLDRSPDQAIINEYTTGQGISKHVDCPRCFGAQIATVSLGSACVMLLRRRQYLHERLLQRRSVLVLNADARDQWTHEIPKRRSDKVNGVKLRRGRRLSVTLRTVRLNSSQVVAKKRERDI